MGVFTYTDEHTSPIPPARIFKASILDSHNLMPKLLPGAITSVEIIKGDGGAGSIKQINFAGGSVKHQIDEVNEKTLTYRYTLIEGDGISDKIEKVSYDIKFEGSSDGGTISKMTTTISLKIPKHMFKDCGFKIAFVAVFGIYMIPCAFIKCRNVIFLQCL